MHELCSDWHASYTGSIAPYSLSRGNPLKFTLFRNIHSWICATQRLHARTSVTSYTSVNIYNFNSRLAHLYALWMEYVSSLRTGIMAEYPVMSTSQGTYVRIEQTSEVIRVTYEICRAGARGLELRTVGLGQCRTICLKILSVHLDSHLPPVCLFIFPFLDCAVFVFLFYFKQSLQLFSYDSLYFFLLSIFFFFAAIRMIKKVRKSRQTSVDSYVNPFFSTWKASPHHYQIVRIMSAEASARRMFPAKQCSCWQLAVF